MLHIRYEVVGWMLYIRYELVDRMLHIRYELLDWMLHIRFELLNGRNILNVLCLPKTCFSLFQNNLFFLK